MTAQARPHSVTGDGAVHTGPCTLRGLALFSAAGATVIVYDNITASGTILAKFVLGANGDKQIDFSDGRRCDIGVYVDTTAAVEGHVAIG